MGCDNGYEAHLAMSIVSIHAPVWGATAFNENVGCYQRVSIHAPVWGATSFKGVPFFVGSVSIHAPVWGATLKANKQKTLSI